MFHLLSNLKTTYKKHAKEYSVPFFAAATMYTEKKFEYHMKELDKLDKRIRPYLQKIGYHKWSRFYSKNKRYSVMTSNIVESLNAATMAARKVPATTLLECFCGLLQDWTYTNRKLAQKTMRRLTPVAEQALTNNFVYSLRLTVKPANEYLFEVFKEDKSWIGMNIDPYDYCSHYYTTKVWLETYDATVYPVGKQQHWELLDFFKDITVLPPFERVKAGRPKKRRIIAAWETKKKNKCSKCG
ncbi:uncharacterized protein LOC133779694 [Humulus lupulus]|uniref:uncharacterized protein LOC133779694 n=1 Tax=Humulus lupulus TaxID=3486 RepID=UPI002B40C173|nr:uncharacterized protein LOC133779694 [Humulus lupulus]